MKTESCKLYSRDFWIFLPNNIKIDHYNFELYRFQVGPFFETQCTSTHELNWPLTHVVLSGVDRGHDKPPPATGNERERAGRKDEQKVEQEQPEKKQCYWHTTINLRHLEYTTALKW